MEVEPGERLGSIVLGVPVKWVEDRMENLQATAFARDYHMTGEIASMKDGRITALRCHVIADHGAFDACADPSKFPAMQTYYLDILCDRFTNHESVEIDPVTGPDRLHERVGILVQIKLFAILPHKTKYLI